MTKPDMEPEITRRQFKRYASLDSARHRRDEGLFVAEGTKCVLDLMRAFPPEAVYADAAWAADHPEAGASVVSRATLRELTRLSATPPVVAFLRLPVEHGLLPDDPSAFVIVLDRVQDPGNLGTIIRTADWMGVDTIVASPDTVDAFNPKTVQATMGSLARVRVIYTPLEPFLKARRDAGITIYGTFLGGENLYTTAMAGGGAVVMGNEGSGISPQIEALVTKRITIPSPPGTEPSAESLNVAVATALVLARRAQCIFDNGKNQG